MSQESKRRKETREKPMQKAVSLKQNLISSYLAVQGETVPGL